MYGHAYRLRDLLDVMRRALLCAKMVKTFLWVQEQSQQIAAGEGQKFEEQSTVDGKVTTDAETDASVQSAYRDPIGSASCAESENTSQEECRVERRAATNDIGRDTPE